MFSPKYRPEINPVWSVWISFLQSRFYSISIAPDAILYTVLSNDIGL